MNEYRVMDNYAELIVDSPKHGKIILKIDIDDVDRCKSYRWCVNKFKNEYFYGITDHGRVLLHRFITNAVKGEHVDHINKNTLDNRKVNLRAKEPKINMRNIKTQKNNKLGVKGVCIHKPTGKYMAYICCNKKKITLGYFSELEDAIQARINAELKYFGEIIKR